MSVSTNVDKNTHIDHRGLTLSTCAASHERQGFTCPSFWAWSGVVGLWSKNKTNSKKLGVLFASVEQEAKLSGVCGRGLNFLVYGDLAKIPRVLMLI